MNFSLSGNTQPTPWPMPPRKEETKFQTLFSDEDASSQKLAKTLTEERVKTRDHEKREEPIPNFEGLEPASVDSTSAHQNGIKSASWSSNSEDLIPVDEFFTSNELFVASKIDRELDAQVPTLRSVNKLFGAEDDEQYEPEPRSQTAYSNKSFSKRKNKTSKKSQTSVTQPNSELVEDSKPALRRPIGSRRTRVIDIPQGSDRQEHEEEPENPKSARATNSEPVISQPTLQESRDARIAAQKGILMRTQTHHKSIPGIRRAETGVIMSKQELLSTNKRNIPAHPVPKSLRPWIVDENAGPETMLLSPASYKGTPRSGFRPPLPRSKKQFVSTGKNEQNDEEMSLSPIQQATKSGRSSTRTEQNSLPFSEGGPSTGLVGMLSNGLRKATTALGRKSGTEIGKGSETDIFIRGTVDEAVCRICAICRNILGYRVVVKRNSRKIRVESMGEEDDEYLKAVLVIRKLEESCSINIRQSRGDGMKTSIGALWMFYQRLQAELNRTDDVSSGLFSEGSLTPRSKVGRF